MSRKGPEARVTRDQGHHTTWAHPIPKAADSCLHRAEGPHDGGVENPERRQQVR